MLKINPKMETLHTLAEDMIISYAGKNFESERSWAYAARKSADFFEYVNENNLYGPSVGVIIAEHVKIDNALPHCVNRDQLATILENTAKRFPRLKEALDKYVQHIDKNYSKNLETRKGLVLSRSVRYDKKRAQLLENGKSAHNLHRHNIFEKWIASINKIREGAE